MYCFFIGSKTKLKSLYCDSLSRYIVIITPPIQKLEMPLKVIVIQDLPDVVRVIIS